MKVETHKLLDDSLDELGEVQSLVRLALPDVFAQHGDGFCVGVGVKVVSTLNEDGLELLVCDVSFGAPDVPRSALVTYSW